jgi:hypothetical protein
MNPVLSEGEKAFTMEVSGTRRWLCPFCRLEITMAIARNLLDEEDEEPERRDDWEDRTGADTEDNEEAKDYSHRRGYAATTTRSLFSGSSIVVSQDEVEAMEAETLSSEPGQADATLLIPEVAPKKLITWGENQVQEYPISKRDIRDRRYADSVMEADPRYAKEQALLTQSAAVVAPADMSVGMGLSEEGEWDSSPQEGEAKLSQAQKKKATRSIRKNKRNRSRNITSVETGEEEEVVTKTEG